MSFFVFDSPRSNESIFSLTPIAGIVPTLSLVFPRYDVPITFSLSPSLRLLLLQLRNQCGVDELHDRRARLDAVNLDAPEQGRIDPGGELRIAHRLLPCHLAHPLCMTFLV